ncbi:MAG: MarR family transcriptional regulator [Phycisphaerales bacterium]|jgi:DNA-binding MarR family transcriptional regulator|nr:MarR family transcriptional regulator [Phycisphaerales bacterium]
MAPEQFLRSHIPDYRRLRDLTKKVPELDPDDVMTVVLLRTIADELTAQLRASLDRHGISEGRLRVLANLLDHDGPATHSEIANASGVTKGTITGLIDGLERDGLVRRSACTNDRRVCYIELTDKGERLLKKILPGHLERLSELVGAISKPEQKTLLRLLKKFRAGLFAASDEAASEEEA